MDNLCVFVKVDLLLHEETFDALRDFLSNASADTISNYCFLEFLEDKILAIAHHKLYNNAMLNLIGQKIGDDYLLISVKSLMKLVFLE